MKKKSIRLIILFVVLTLCIIAYFKPLSFSNIVSSDHAISLILNEYRIKDGEPDIDVTAYKDITAEQKRAILACLDEYTYRRTLRTPFSNGSMTGLGTKMLSIYAFDDASDGHLWVISSKEIVMDGKNYRMKNAEALIEQIISMMQ